MTFPPDFTYPVTKVVAASLAAKVIASLVPERRAVVQAGGCVGLWPFFLSKLFGHVYTFEPAPENFRCLRRNVANATNVTAWQAAVGDKSRGVRLTRPKPHAGLWCVDGDGDIPMVRLDEVVGDVAIDAIVLDVEGHEVPALRGAERLITTHHPLVWCEFLQHTAEIDAFLRAHGYASPTRGYGSDWYSIHSSRVVH